MRYFILSVFLWVTDLNVNAQTNLQKIINEFSVPSGWHSEIDYDTSYFPLFQKSQLASWNLIGSQESQEVTYYIYNYSVADSTSIIKKMLDYYMLSSCINFSSTIPEENFISFVKGQYFFLMKMCPCSTANISSCKILAKKLFLWASTK